MGKRLLSLCMALALCLSLLPATALAADGVTLRIGNTTITESGYWTTSDGGNTFTYVNGAPSSGGYIHYVPNATGGPTLTLNNVTIAGTYDASNNIEGTGIYMSSSSGSASLTIMLQGDNNQVSGASGIYVFSDYGDASLSISGTGSLTAKGRDYGNHSGIMVQSNGGKAELTINNVDVTATNSNTQGIRLQPAGTSPATLAVNGGSLTASGSKGIDYQFGTGATGSGTPTVTVSNNAIVRANGSAGGITSNSSTGVQYGTGSNSTGGIVFNGNEGTVYGNVTLQKDLTIGEGERLDIPSGASLTIDSGATLTNEGTVTNNGTLTNNGTINNSGTLPSNIGGNTPPSITTTSPLVSGTVGTEYSVTLAASGTETIIWSNSGNLPAGLTLDENTGVISGTPTADGTFNFTVKATNTGGSDSEQLSITIDAQTNVPVTGVTLSQTELSLTEGNTAQLTATVKPDDATNKNVTWSSDDTSVATVDATGKVTAVSAGTATITVTTVDGGYKDTCQVTVTAALVPVSGVTLNKDSLALGVGDTETLTATVAPANAANQSVTWASSDPSVATVDQNGVVTAVAPGTATITVTTQAGNHTAACTVTVRPDIPPANPNYRITVEATQGGTVTADPTAAKAGTTVTLTPVPDRGYQVGTVAVTDRFGDPVAVTEQADGTYTFVMPNGQVTVTVTFAEAPLPFPDVTEGDWFYDAVRYAYETGLMDGVGDNLFAPNSQTTRAQLVTILYRLEGEPEVSGTSGFTDVEADTWYTDAVVWAAENGIVNGVSETEFAPGKDITREQLATILFRYAEAKGYDVSARADLSAYPDADQIQSYAAESVAWAVAEGLIQGFEDNTLRPAGNASRAQIATILMRFCEGVAK